MVVCLLGTYEYVLDHAWPHFDFLLLIFSCLFLHELGEVAWLRWVVVVDEWEDHLFAKLDGEVYLYLEVIECKGRFAPLFYQVEELSKELACLKVGVHASYHV